MEPKTMYFVTSKGKLKEMVVIGTQQTQEGVLAVTAKGNWPMAWLSPTKAEAIQARIVDTMNARVLAYQKADELTRLMDRLNDQLADEGPREPEAG